MSRTVQFFTVDHRNRVKGEAPPLRPYGTATMHDDGTIEYSDESVRRNMAPWVHAYGLEKAFDLYYSGWCNGYAGSQPLEEASASH